MSATDLDPDVASQRRRDLDGLRALAVAAILIFHAAPALAPGGFVGVDVFFVLSGFLITGVIVQEREAGRFGFAQFYLRRARRILPAYVVVLATVAVAAWAILLPREMATLGWSLGGSALFLANVVFAQGGGYFEPMAEQSPLLHLWSLSVEEQFYLVWPWLILGLTWPPLRRSAGSGWPWPWRWPCSSARWPPPRRWSPTAASASPSSTCRSGRGSSCWAPSWPWACGRHATAWPPKAPRAQASS